MFVFLLNCMEKYKPIDNIAIEIKDNDLRVDAELELFSNPDVKYLPYAFHDNIKFYDLPTGNYTLIVEKECYETLVSNLKVYNFFGNLYYKGDLTLTLKKKNLPSANIIALGLDKLVLKNKTYKVKVVKNSLIEFNVDDIGQYTVFLEREHVLKVLAYENKIAVLMDGNFINRINHIPIFRFKLSLSDSLFHKLKEIDFNLKTKKLELISFKYENNPIECIAEIFGKEEGLEAEISISIGAFKISKSLFAEFDGVNFINKEPNFVIEGIYRITKLNFNFPICKLNLSVDSGAIVIDNEIFIHSISSPLIQVHFDTFESIVFNSELEEVSFALIPKMPQLKLYSCGSKLRFELKSPFPTTELYLLDKLNNVFEKIERTTYKRFGTTYCLVIEKDEIIRRQTILPIPYQENSLPFYYTSICLSDKYDGKYCMNGSIYLNLNEDFINNYFNRLLVFRPNIEKAQFVFKYMKDDETYFMEEAVIDIERKENNFKLILNQNRAVKKHGDSLAINLFRINRSFSKIDSSKYYFSLLLVIVNKAVNLELNPNIFLFKDNETIDVNTINSRIPREDINIINAELLTPNFSSQTFNLILSYSTNKKVLKNGFYENFLRSDSGTNKLVLTKKNASSGLLGQNFIQRVEKTQEEYNSLFGSLSSIIQGNVINQIAGVAGLLFSLSDIFFGYSSKVDTKSWLSNFCDAKGRKILQPNLKNQMNYAIEWSAYVFVKELHFPESTILLSESKVKIEQTFYDIDGEHLGEKIDSNYEPSKSDELPEINNKWLLYKCRIDKVGNCSLEWGAIVIIDFIAIRHTKDILDSVENEFF